MSMGGGGGSDKQTVTTELDPMVKPFVEFGLNEAQRLYDTGGPSFFPGQTYVGPSSQTQQGLQMAQDRALAGSPLLRGAQDTVGALQTATNPALGGFADVYGRAMQDPASNFYSSLASGGGSDILNQDRANQLYGQASMGDPSANFYGAMQGGAFQNAAMPGTQAVSEGAYLGGNPFFQGAFQPAARAAQDTFNQGIQGVSSQASQAGRYGSGAMGQLQDRASNQFAQALSDTAGQLAYQNYGQERGLQENARQQLAGLSQQDLSNRLTGAQNISQGAQQTLNNQLGMMNASAGLNQQDLANRMSGASALSGINQQGLQTQLAATQGLGQTASNDFARQLQAAGMSPDMASQDYADIQRLIDLGQTQENYQQLALGDAMQRFNFEQNAPYAGLQTFLSAAYGAPMGSQVSQPIYNNQLGGAVSGGLLGAGLGTRMAGADGNQLVYGAGGAGLGALAGAFA